MSARIKPMISYCPIGLGKLGKKIVETEAVCSRCGNIAWVPRAEHRSRVAACVMLRLSCPRKESNFYVEAEDAWLRSAYARRLALERENH